MKTSGNQLIIIYDNYTLTQNLTPAWGFSCLITLPQCRLLFDTGGDPSILFRNMQELGVDPNEIKRVVLSHAHGDHVGGLLGFLAHATVETVYVPKSFPEDFNESIRRMGPHVEAIGGPMMIHPGVYTTGEMGRGLKEQSLILKTDQGLVVITGCAHPGIVEIVEYATAAFGEDVYLLIGGFHLVGHSTAQLKDIAEKLAARNVKKIAPCHCSGDEARAFFNQYYKDHYIACAAGLFLDLPDIKP